MTNTIALAKQQLLDPTGITEQGLESVLGQMLGHRIDTGELYFQSNVCESWMLEDGILKQASYDIDRGVGVRALSGEKTGFAYSDDILMPTLTQAANAAGSIASRGDSQVLQVGASVLAPQNLYGTDNPLNTWSETEKVAFLQRLDAFTRKQDSRVKEVIINLNGVYESMLVANSHGHLSADIRPLIRLDITVIVESDGKREQGRFGGGGRRDYHYFTEQDRAFDYAKEAVRQALVKLDAIEAPAGEMPVVLGSGWPGVLLHEAIGHGLEGDFNRKGLSAYAGRLGEVVASPLCTVVDDGTLEGLRGSLNIDDEGQPTQCTTLIENGVLKTYMQDSLNAKLMGMQPTGNGRRESYAHVPMPRMTNTYMLPGQHHPDEIIRSVKKGVYAVNFDGGQVDITSGKFVFSASEAYLIEEGKVTAPIKGMTLIGDGPSVLTQVSMVGNDLSLDTGIGVCGKEGQSVPVGVGQPTLKVDKMTVGGTRHE